MNCFSESKKKNKRKLACKMYTLINTNINIPNNIYIVPTGIM